MNCGEVQKNLSAHIDDEAAPEMCAEVEAHLASCKTCAGEAAVLRRIKLEISRMPLVAVPPRRNEIRRRFASIVPKIAAAAAVALVFAGLMFVALSPRDVVASAVAFHQKIESGAVASDAARCPG